MRWLTLRLHKFYHVGIDFALVILKLQQLVCKGYLYQEGVDYDKTYDPVARIEVVRLLLNYVVHKKFKVYQTDVKSTFLNGKIEEEVYIE